MNKLIKVVVIKFKLVLKIYTYWIAQFINFYNGQNICLCMCITPRHREQTTFIFIYLHLLFYQNSTL